MIERRHAAEDVDNAAPTRARRSVGSSEARRWGVSLKIWLTFSALILLFGLSGLVSYQYIGRIDNDLAQIVEVEEPLEQAVLEMEINASETALAVLGFIRDQDPAQLHIIRDSEADFRRFVGEFERLAETDEEQRLGGCPGRC